MKSLRHVALLFLLLSSLTLVPAAVRAQDVRGYEIDRYEYFTQCTTNPPPLNTARVHRLAAFVSGFYDGAVLTGTLAHAGVSWPLTNRGSGVEAHVLLTTAASAGAYSFTVSTASQGEQRGMVALPGAANRIAPARIANFTEAQAVEASQPFTVRWDPIRGTGARDFLQLRVFNSDGDQLFSSQVARDETSATIPGGTLAPGTTNTAYLYIVHLASRRIGSNGRPFSLGVEIRATRFALTTHRPEGRLAYHSHQAFAHETNGTIHIGVERSGSEGTVTVDYFTADGTARAGVNYVATNGTLTFPPGITNQAIAVPLLDDGQATGPLLARVHLTNATGGAVLPARPILDWSILDGQAAPGPNVNAIVLSKVSFYSQTNDSPGDAFTRCVTSRFFASVHPKFPGALGFPILHLPRKGTRTLTMAYRTFREYEEDFPTRALLDRQYPAGPYLVEVSTLTEGTLAESGRMTAEPPFPVPHLTNWTAAQTIDATMPFTLQWESFQPATSNDFILVGVRDDSGVVVLETPESFEPGVLPASATAYEIPASTLLPDQRYFANLIFGKAARCVTNAVSGVKNCTIFDHTTSFEIHTQPLAPDSWKRSASPRFKGEADCCSAGLFQELSEGPLMETFNR